MAKPELDKSGGTVDLQLFGNLARFGGEKTHSFPLGISADESVDDLINRLGIPKGEVSFAVINEVKIDDYSIQLKPGDRIKLFGLVGGG